MSAFAEQVSKTSISILLLSYFAVGDNVEVLTIKKQTMIDYCLNTLNLTETFSEMIALWFFSDLSARPSTATVDKILKREAISLETWIRTSAHLFLADN